MLPKYWKLHARNETGQTMTYNDAARLDVRMMPWKWASGAKSYGTLITDDLGFDAGETIADNANTEGDEQDNSTNLYDGIFGYFEAIHDLSTADGPIYLYIEWSDASGGTNWPSDKNEFDITEDLVCIAVLNMEPDAVDESRAVNFVIDF